jgi:hypothetical protein
MPRAYITYKGSHTLDLTDLEGQLVDISEGDRRGMRTELEDFGDALSELTGSNEANRAAAGFHPNVFEHFTMCGERLARIDVKLAMARKQLEVLIESRAYYVDARQNDISLLVDAMRSHAQRRRDRTILIPFEKTLRYASQIGDKGAKTKRRLAEEAAATGRAPKGKGKARGARKQQVPRRPEPVEPG